MIRKGRGVSTIFYPSGFDGGGDPDLVTLRMKPDGTIDVSNASCEMGQGIKNVAVQIAAEALGIGVDRMNFDNRDSDNAAFSMDTAGTRSTVVVGNAIIAAANDLIDQFKDFVAGKFGVSKDEMSYAEGRTFVTADPEKGMTIPEIAGATIYGGILLTGRGGFLPEVAGPRDPKTGATNQKKVLAYGSCVADVEVDDETGMVRVVNIFNCYDMGTVINPSQALSQVEGGNIMGIGMALFEDLAPNFPNNLDMYAANFTDYIVPTFMDSPDRVETTFYENYDPVGPFGAKGCGEMVVDTQSPAIVNAIYDAVGVVVESLPASPDKVLRLIKEKQ